MICGRDKLILIALFSLSTPMSVALRRQKVVPINDISYNYYTLTMDDEDNFYYITGGKIMKSGKDVITHIIIDYFPFYIKGLSCHRVDDRMYFVIFLKPDIMLLYEGNERVDVMQSQGAEVHHSNEKSPSVGYYLDGHLRRIAIKDARLIVEAIEIDRIAIANHVEVCNTNEYLYVIRDHTIVKYNNATGEQTPIDMNSIFAGITSMTFSIDGGYVIVQTISHSNFIKISALSNGEFSDIIPCVIGFQRKIIVVDDYAMLTDNYAYDLRKRERLAIVDKPTGRYGYQIDNKQIYTIQDQTFFAYGFKWNIKHVHLQTPEVQQAVITAYLCLQRIFHSLLPRELIIAIINYAHAQ